jgi:hypothetical protein
MVLILYNIKSFLFLYIICYGKGFYFKRNVDRSDRRSIDGNDDNGNHTPYFVRIIFIFHIKYQSIFTLKIH